MLSELTGVLRMYKGLAGSSDMNLVLINGLSLSKLSSIVNLNMDTLFVDTGALRVEISSRKAQICINLQPVLWLLA